MKKIVYILYGNSGLHSGRALRLMLANETGQKIRGGYPKRFRKTISTKDNISLVVNLGTTEDIPYEGGMFNTQDMVRAASNKKKARQIFTEQGVPAPDLYLKANDIPADSYPVVGRTSYHKKGQGFWLCKNAKSARSAEAAGATHFLRFIPDTREYRVHTFIKLKHQESKPEERTADHYVSVKMSEKVWEGAGAPAKGEPQKNHEFGWTFLAPQNRSAEELDVVRYAAKQAIASLGMDFGAVDVMYKIRTKTPFVLEVNSTPSLANEQADTCEVYMKRILKMIGSAKEE